MGPCLECQYLMLLAHEQDHQAARGAKHGEVDPVGRVREGLLHLIKVYNLAELEPN